MRNGLKEGKDETLEAKILSVADKVDLLVMNHLKIQKGIQENIFAEIYKNL